MADSQYGTLSPTGADGENQGAEAEAPAQTPLLDGLTHYTLEKFREAVHYRSTSSNFSGISITQALIDAERQKRGVLDPAIKGAIDAFGHCSKFFNISAAKAFSVASWLRAELDPNKQRRYGLRPTPVPSLPEGSAADAREETRDAVLKYPVVPTPSLAEDIADHEWSKQEKRVFEEATEKAQRAERRVSDILVEGGFYEALNKFIEDFSTYQFAVLTGPFNSVKRKLVWRGDKAEVAEVAGLSFDCPSPHEVFWEPNSIAIGDGAVFTIRRFSRTELQGMRGKPHYNTAAIDAVLADENLDIFSDESVAAQEVKEAESRNMGDSGYILPKIEALDSYLCVLGQDLLEWGFEDKDRVAATDYYEIACTLIGKHVVWAMLNPNPLGKKPVHATSFKTGRGIAGESAMTLMSEMQDVYGAAGRSMMNNLAMSALPKVVADKASLVGGENALRQSPQTPVFWDSRESMLHAGVRPIEYVDIPNKADQFLRVMGMAADAADNASLVPRYMQGDLNTGGGAGDTASGLNMLMLASKASLYDALANIEQNIIGPVVEMVYEWLLLNDPDPRIKGDLQVVIQTTPEDLRRRQQSRDARDLLGLGNNPVDMAILGEDGRRKLWKKAVLELEDTLDPIVPSEREMRLRMVAAQQPAAGPAAPLAPLPGGGLPPQSGMGEPVLGGPGNPFPETAPNTETPQMMSGMLQEGQDRGLEMRRMPEAGVTP